MSTMEPSIVTIATPMVVLMRATHLYRSDLVSPLALSAVRSDRVPTDASGEVSHLR